MFEKVKKLVTLEDISLEYGFTGLDIDKVIQYLNSPNVYNPLDGRSTPELEHKGLREIYLMYDPEYMYYTVKTLLNVELTPIQCCTLKEFWTHAFPMLIGSRGFSKSFLLAVYSLLRAVLFQGTKIIITGAAFRQSKYVYDYIQTIWRNAPIAQSIFKGFEPSAKQPDMWKFIVGRSEIICTPVGTGDKIRGLRGNIIIADEFNSINTEIYEVVISQFAAVSTSPIDNVKVAAQRKILESKGIKLPEAGKKLSYFNNQSIISGTMKFDFEPLAIYWRKYKDIIESKGERLEEMFGEGAESLNWKDFTIIRVPFEAIPAGFMDEKIVARSKATMHTEYYKAEYNCLPISDTDGFFKRSLIESCTAKTANLSKDNWPSWCPNTFEGKIRGMKGPKYVIGVDPASEQDNFSIVILELYPEHQRVVYCWTTNRESFKKQNSISDDKNYYAMCARKIRDLMKQFSPCIAIGIDSQGGGYAVEEALHDNDKLHQGEVPIWPIIDPNDPQDTDHYAGLHILHMINFASSEWTSSSNHWMKKDMEDKLLLFPRFDPVLLGLASEKDKDEMVLSGQLYDTLEDCMIELEALKDELSIITRIRTPAGRERWDTPEVKTGRNRKEKLRKDRYSALLIANAVGRSVYRAIPDPEFKCVGAAVGSKVDRNKTGRMYDAEWYNTPSSMFKGIKH